MRKRSNDHTNQSGYSLLELIAVVSVISILLVVSLPPAVKQFIILPKADEAKAILNLTIAECLRSVRSGAAPSSTILDSTIISNERLEPLGYKLHNASYNPNCSRTEISPINATEELLYQMGFVILPSGKVVKNAVPARDKSSLPSCKSWAGVNCGVSPEQQAEWDRLAKIEADKKACNDAFYTFLSSGSNGQKNVWDEVSQSCSRVQWVLDGTRYTSKDSYDAAFTAKVGKECAAALVSYTNNNPPNGPYKNEACDIDTYFLNGSNLESSDPAVYQAKQKEYNDLQCNAAEQAWLSNGKAGAFTWPAGLSCIAKWKCPAENNKVYLDLNSYNTSSCATPPPDPPPPERKCLNWSRRGYCKLWSY